MREKEIIKKILSIFMCILFLVSGMVLPVEKIQASLNSNQHYDKNDNVRNIITEMHMEDKSGNSKPECVQYNGDNIEAQNYQNALICSDTVKSYLVPEADGLLRVQYNKVNEENLLVEHYDDDYNLTSAKTISLELPIWGGVYVTENNYFVVTGQNNPDESDSVEVFRITKYDKDWNRISSAGLKGANTVEPFEGGSCRMDACGKYLLIRTCHKMYKSSDGKNHQANVTIQLDMDAMKITDSYTKIMNKAYGYVSHSFNQFIKIENNQIVALDHGDANPRSIVLTKYVTDVTTGSFVPWYYNPCTTIDVLSFPGEIGANDTGASVGGFEISGTKYIVAGNSVVQDEYNLQRKTRNIFVSVVDKSTLKVTSKWITSFDEGERSVSNPQLVKVSDNRFVLIWSRSESVYYTELDGNGNQTSIVYSHEGSISDCQPVVKNNKLTWYVWNNNITTFYKINLNNLNDITTKEVYGGHSYINFGVENGIASLHCTKCGVDTKLNVVTDMNVWWNDNEGEGNYYSMINSTRTVGDELYCWVETDETKVNGEVEIISSDNSVISVEIKHSIMGMSPTAILHAKNSGEVNITVRPKYNPDRAETYYFYVSREARIKSFTSNVSSPQKLGKAIRLEAEATGGSGQLEYMFYTLDYFGAMDIIKDYDSSQTCIWIPKATGVYNLCVDVKDEEGNVTTASSGYVYSIYEDKSDETTEPVTEKPTERPTQPITEKPAESSTQPVTEKPAENSTQPVTEKPTENLTQPVTEKRTERPTQPVTEKPTKKLINNVISQEYKPANVKIKRLKNLKGKKMKISWKRTSGESFDVDGWQVQYALNKKFTKTKKTKKIAWYKDNIEIKKLKKGKKYYVRIRAYKKDNYGIKKYGKWSNVKTVKVNK